MREDDNLDEENAKETKKIDEGDDVTNNSKDYIEIKEAK